MPIKAKNITGCVFGRLTVIKQVGRNSGRAAIWECLCSCGVIKNITAGTLRNGTTKSCGCLRQEVGLSKLTHGYSYTTEYKTWTNMIRRCYVPTAEGYQNYGGAGVSVCDRWKNSFENFLEDMGFKPTPKHTIDRFPNQTGNYEMSNCRWATVRQQAGNRKSNKWLEYNGRKMILADWAREFGVCLESVMWHLKRKSFEEVYKYYLNKQKRA